MPTSTSARIPHPGAHIALWFYLGQIPYLPSGSEVQKEKCTSTPDDPVQKELRKSQSHILTGQERKSKVPSKKIVILFHRKVHGLAVNQSYDHIPIKKQAKWNEGPRTCSCGWYLSFVVWSFWKAIWHSIAITKIPFSPLLEKAERASLQTVKSCTNLLIPHRHVNPRYYLSLFQSHPFSSEIIPWKRSQMVEHMIPKKTKKNCVRM